MSPEKDFTHLRDHVWGDLKERTLKKRDRLNTTGSQGEEYSKLEECVLEVLGTNSELVQGLPVREQWGDDVAPAAVQGSSKQSAR